jgi:CO dehydrogenase nickel-insertion accessory protein CooC1
MSLNFDIEVEISGKEHQGKTTLVAYLTKLLTDAGAELIVQRADPQIDEKLGLSLDKLREKVVGKKIFIREVQEPYRDPEHQL